MKNQTIKNDPTNRDDEAKSDLIGRLSGLVEYGGFEPPTSCVRCRRSTK